MAIPPHGVGSEPGLGVLDHLARDVRRAADVVRRSPLAAAVPSYPAFTTETLAGHVGRALRRFRHLLDPESPPPPSPADTPTGPAVADFLEAGLDPLLDAFARARPDQTVALAFASIPVPAFPLVTATEVGIHRWDLESVLGEHAPVATDLAAAILDDVFVRWVQRLDALGPLAPLGGRALLHATDTDDRWAVAVDDGRVSVGRTDIGLGAFDATLRAPMETLLMVVWKRLPASAPGAVIDGDREVVERFLAIDYVPDPRTSPAH